MTTRSLPELPPAPPRHHLVRRHDHASGSAPPTQSVLNLGRIQGGASLSAGLNPSWSKLFTFPYDIIVATGLYIKARNKGLIAEQNQALVQLLGTPVTVLNAYYLVISKLILISTLIQTLRFPPFSVIRPYAFTGTVLSILECSYRTYHLYKIIQLHKELFANSDNELSSYDILIKNHLTTVGTTEEEKKADKNRKTLSLYRMISPFLVDHVLNHKHILEGNDKAGQTELMVQIKTNLEKRIIIHAVAIMGLALFILGMSLALAYPITFITVTVVALSTLLTTAGYYLECGWDETIGWDFCVTNCFPYSLRWIYDVFAKTDWAKHKHYVTPCFNRSNRTVVVGTGS